jgi:hypothetical protein
LCLENRDKDDERKQIHENNNKIHLSYLCGVRRHHARARRCRSRHGPSITTKETTIQQRAIAACSSKAYRSTGHARGGIATGLLWSRPKMDLASCDLKLSALREPLCVLRTNHRFEFQKRRQLFIRVDDETFSVAAGDASPRVDSRP